MESTHTVFLVLSLLFAKSIEIASAAAVASSNRDALAISILVNSVINV